MKIAFILGLFPTLSETFILNQITGLLDLGHEVDIFAHYNPHMGRIHPDVEAYRLMERTHYFSIPTNKVKRVLKALGLVVANFYEAPTNLLQVLNVFKYGRYALSLRLLYALVPFLGKEQEYDIVHCHFGPNGKIGVLLRDLAVQGKIVVTFHGYDISSYVRSQGNTVYDYLFRKADLFTVNTDFVQRRIIELGCDPGKIVKLPAGLPIEKFSFKKKESRPEGCVKVVTVARLIEKKGLEYSIKATAKVMKKHPNVEYNIAGNGPLKGQLECLISELGVEEHIKLLGWQDQHQIGRLYQESHIFVLASVTARNGDQEGQGLVLQEAQAMGLPVVSTLHNGIPEGVLDGQSGFLVPERDADALAERLEYLIEHPDLWPDMGWAGRKFVEEHYDIKKLNRRLVEIYEALLKGKKLETGVASKVMG